jgi:hypothetical protein
MATERHVTIIETDVSQALAADAKLRAATEAQTAATKKLAAVLEEGERERIASMRASHDAHVRAAAGRRMDALDARAEMAAAREDAAAARRDIADRAAAQRKAATEERQAAKQSAAAAKETAAAIAAIPAPGSGFLSLAGNIGMVVAGLGTLAAGAERAVRIADEVASQSLKAQQVSASLQVSIGGARQAFKGYVDDIELARIANMAFEMGVVDTGAELAELAAGVQAKSERLGVSSTELFENAVTAIGRGSALVLDNLGIVLDAAKAEEIYAEALGKTVDELTAYEKEQSFAKAATIEIAKAGKEAAVEVDGLASSWRQATVDLTNFKTAWLGFDDSLGTLRENLRGLTAEQLEALASGGVSALQDVMRGQEAAAKGQAELLQAQATYSTHHAVLLREEARRYEIIANGAQNEASRAEATAEAVRLKAEAVAEEENSVAKLALAHDAMAKAEQADAKKWVDTLEAAAKIEGGWSDSHENRIKAGETLRREASTALIHNTKEEAEASKLAAQAEIDAAIKKAETDAIAIDQQVALAEQRNAKEAEVIPLQYQSLQLRAIAAELAGEEAKALELRNKADLALLGKKDKDPKSGGKKRDPNEALDRETDATLRLLGARAKIYAAEHENERDLATAAAQRFYLLELAREELEVRERAADSRKVKGAKEADKLEAERLEITTERRLIDIEVEKLAREEGRRHAEETLAAMDREIERQAALGVAVGLLEQRRADAHVAMVAEFGETEELRQAEHERDVQKIEDERAYVESQGQAKLQAFDMETEIAQARGQQIYDIESRRLELEARIAAAEGDHARQRALLHKAEVARIEERRAKLARATQTTNSMLGQGAALFSAIADQTIKDEAKREKAALRARGVEAVARGALETVEAVASFASLNIVQGVLHTAAAATAFATGIPMIAGKVPDKGAGAASGGGAGHQTVVNADTSSSGSGSSMGGSPMTPPSAEEMINLRQQQGGTLQTTASKQQGGTVIQIGTLITGDSGTILHDYNQQQLKKRGTA